MCWERGEGLFLHQKPREKLKNRKLAKKKPYVETSSESAFVTAKNEKLGKNS